MPETLFSLLMLLFWFACLWMGWYLRGVADKPTVTTKPPTSHVTRPSQAPYKIEPSPFIVTPFTPEELEEQTYLFGPFPLPEGWEPPANLLEPIDSQAANKRNRERILANMRAGKRNN